MKVHLRIPSRIIPYHPPLGTSEVADLVTTWKNSRAVECSAVRYEL